MFLVHDIEIWREHDLACVACDLACVESVFARTACILSDIVGFGHVLRGDRAKWHAARSDKQCT